LALASSSSLEHTARILSETRGEATAVVCGVTSDAVYTNRNKTAFPGAKSQCIVCGPSSINVTQGQQVSYTIYLSSPSGTACSVKGWYESWYTPYHVSASTTSGANGSTAWVVTAQADAYYPDKNGYSLAEWIVGSNSDYAAFKTQINVLPKPVTQSCPTGYSSQSSIAAPSPRDPSFCQGQANSPCNVCVHATAISGINPSNTVYATYMYNVVLACPVQSAVQAYDSWSSPSKEASASYKWGPNNAGTNWTVEVTTQEGTKNSPITLLSEWCLNVAGISGYVGYKISIPWPQ